MDGTKERSFMSELDVEEDAYGRRNRPRLDAGPSELTVLTDHNSSSSGKSLGSGHAGVRTTQGHDRRERVRQPRKMTSLSQSQEEVLESITCAPGLEQYSFEVSPIA